MPIIFYTLCKETAKYFCLTVPANYCTKSRPDTKFFVLLQKKSTAHQCPSEKKNTMEKDYDPQKWEVLESEYLFRRPWLTARRDHVRLPDGTENPEYYILEYPDWVNVIARTRDGQFLLIRQYRHALGETRYELCAGVIDPEDASPEAAARRELLEETGYGGGRWRLLSVLSPNASAMTNLSYTFVAEDVEPLTEQHLEATEDITVHLLDSGEVRSLLEHDGIRQALMVAPLWKYFYLNSL